MQIGENAVLSQLAPRKRKGSLGRGFGKQPRKGRDGGQVLSGHDNLFRLGKDVFRDLRQLPKIMFIGRESLMLSQFGQLETAQAGEFDVHKSEMFVNSSGLLLVPADEAAGSGIA